MAIANDTWSQTVSRVGKCTIQEGEIRLIGLPRVLLARCSCGACQKIPIPSVQKFEAVFCPCGQQARLSLRFLDMWTRVRILNGVRDV